MGPSEKQHLQALPGKEEVVNWLRKWLFRRFILPRVYWFTVDEDALQVDLETGEGLIHRDDVRVEWL